jgi:uncharacterized protein (TIGR02466 family)
MELTIEQALQQGVTAHNSGNLQEAERIYQAILRSHPKHPDANHNLGLIAISVNQIEAALSLFKTALDVNPMIEQFWVSYIDALVKANQLKDAKQAVKKAKKKGFDSKKLEVLLSQSKATTDTKVPSQAQLDSLLKHYQNGRFGDAERLAIFITKDCPKHPFGWKVLGAIFGETDRKAEAINANQTAVALSPQDAEAHSNLGITLQELGRLEEAEASYKQAIALKPDYVEAHYNLGNTLKELSRLDEAEASYTQAIALKPDYTEAHSNLGITLQELGRLEEAEASYRQAIALKPDLAPALALAHSNLGNTLKELGRLEEAEASYTKAIALKPDYAEAYSNLGVTLEKLGRLNEAEKSHTQAIALKPDYAEAYSDLGVTLEKLGRSNEAEISYRQAIALKPDYTEAHSNLGITLQELGRLEEAEASLRQAIALKPDFPEAHNNLGNTLRDFGRLEDAEASYREAIALKSDYAYAHNNLGDTLKELGRLEEAEASYTKAIALKPDFAKAYDHLGDLLRILGKFEDAEVCYKKYISLAPFEEPITKSMGSTFFAQGEFQKALSLFDSYNTPDSRSDALKCLHALGNTKEIYKRIEDAVELDDGNLRIAAFASFIAESQQKDTAHRFCRKPLEFLHFSNLSSKMENSNSFIANLIEDLKNIKATWEPPNQSANGGFQSNGNLFRYSNCNIVTLKEIILNEIDAYYEKFQNEHCSFIEKWPAEKNLMGWYIMLKEQGYHHLHIHQSGWLSGVIYLKVVPSLNKNEGAITFNMAVSNISDSNLPNIIHNPEVGDMVLFPSSLYHGTIPFSADTDRIVVSFDLKPG